MQPQDELGLSRHTVLLPDTTDITRPPTPTLLTKTKQTKKTAYRNSVRNVPEGVLLFSWQGLSLQHLVHCREGGQDVDQACEMLERREWER